MINGKYILNSRGVKTRKPTTGVPTDTNLVDNLISDKILFSGINKISPADRAAYVDLLKKIIYYKKCAQSMLETTSILETFSI